MPLAVEAYAPIGDSGWRGVLTSNVLGPTLLALVIFGLIAVIFTKTMAARVLVVFGIGAAISAIAQAEELALPRAAGAVGGDPAGGAHRVADRRPLPADQPQRPSPARWR